MEDSKVAIIADQYSMAIAMQYTPINFQEKLSKFSEHWTPKIIAQMNDYHRKVVKIQGEFVRHDHKDTDEVFIVLEGEIMMPRYREIKCLG